MSVPRSALVSGVTGFIGAALARRLIAEGLDVFGLVRSGSTQRHRLQGLTGLRVLEAPSFDPDALGRLLAPVRPDVVFNLAAYGVPADRTEVHETLHGNVTLLVNLLEALAAAGRPRVVHTGSCSEYGTGEPGVLLTESSPLRPTSVYGAAKVAATFMGRAVAHRLGIPFVVLRLFAVYGPGEAPSRLVPYLLDRLLRHEPVDLSPGLQMRDFTYVDDVAEALRIAATADCLEPGGVYNLCTDVPVSVRQVGTEASDILGCDPALLRWGMRPMRDWESMWLVGDGRLFRESTGWRPRMSLRDGLTATARLHQARAAA